MRLLLRLARSPLGRFLTGLFYARGGFIIPAKRLRETATLMAFRHPQPTYPFHILLVPKKALHSLTDLSAADSAFFSDLFETVSDLVKEFELEKAGYRLVANGGKYQEVAQLHFHLISGVER